ncbi:MAG: diguanylate cyclase [Deltaproteobacteria bacterium]|nr:diguanylate cyclase [Deltaproteobacteria bacterium]
MSITSESSSKSVFRKKTILVADDEPLARESVAEYLEDQGHVVVQAADGLEALGILDRMNPDLVLLDLIMPGMDGFQVLDRLSDRLEKLPVIVISGTGLVQHAVQALKKGAWDFITKPFTELEVLDHAVDRALERARLLRENKAYNEHLEELVQQRTEELRSEIERRTEVEAKLRESEDRFKEMSRRDDLTGLYNSRHFHQQIKTELARSQRYGHSLSLVFLDIDNFKIFNDRYGHVQGDLVLETLGRTIQAHIRNPDSAFRYGGEEFVILLPETPCEKAVSLAERLRKSFAALEFRPMENTVVRITLSVGIAEHLPGEDEIAFVARADKAMYEAKAGGKNMTVANGRSCRRP